LSSSVWYNPIPKASVARKILRRALATDFQGNQENLLFDTILAHIAPHCTHKVANVAQCSPITCLHCSCRIVAPVVGLFACTCSCRFGRRSGLAATIPTLILITESCLLLLPPTSPQHNRTDQFFLSAFHLESINKFSIFLKPCSICRMYGVEENIIKLAKFTHPSSKHGCC
jgi:hypothetical protein